MADPPSRIEAANRFIDRMRDDSEASDVTGGAQRRRQCEEQQRACVAPTLLGPIDRELAKQRDRYGLVALMRWRGEYRLRRVNETAGAAP